MVLDCCRYNLNARVFLIGFISKCYHQGYMRLIFSYLRKHLPIFMITVLLLAVESLSGLLLPTMLSYIVDKGIAEKSISQILAYGGMMLLITAIGAIAAILRNITSSKTAQSVAADLRFDIYSHTLSLEQESIDSLDAGSIITRITSDVISIQEFVMSLMRMTIKSPFTLIGALVLTIIATPRATPILVILTVVVSLLIFLNVRIGYPRFGRLQSRIDQLNSKAMDFLSSVRIVKAFCGEDIEREEFNQASDSLRKANTEALESMAFFTPLISCAINLSIVLLLVISRNQEVGEIGKLMASISYMTQMLLSFGMISHSLNTATRASASASRIKEVLEEESNHIDGSTRIPGKIESISFDNVSFSYEGAKKKALSNISFNIEKSEKIGIIGPTGSGKTTLINLIDRLYDSSSGTIYINDIPINEIDTHSLRSSISIVFQKSVLFTGTIKDNLLWGKKNADEEDLRRALSFASAKFAYSMPDGLDTKLGQGGVNLSGGQKQRLCIARAILHSPDVLILDDSTSAIDTMTERRIIENIRKLDDMCVIMISQRIPAVSKMDRIICLNESEIAGIGSHDELISSCNEYQEIARSQLGGEDER